MLYIGVPALALALTFVAVALLIVSQPEYAFLKGRTPVRFPKSSGEPEVTCYSFKQDFDSLREVAVAELKSKGLKAATSTIDLGGGKSYTYTMDSGTFLMFGLEKRVVMIQKDTCLDASSVGSKMPKKKPARGWILVTVLWEPQPDAFSRFRDWIGL
jgi:hypothetical protein